MKPDQYSLFGLPDPGLLGNLDLRRARVFTPRLDHRRLLLRRPPMPAIVVLRRSVKTMTLRSAMRQTVE